MEFVATRVVPAFIPEALAASQVGTWETYVDKGCIIADAVSAAIFGFDPDEAVLGLPISAYQDRVHIADRPATIERYAHMRTQGGLYVFEYRTVPREGVVRWALVRGVYERDQATGSMVGRGIVIDITESKLDGRGEDRAFFFDGGARSDEAPLDRVAALAIEVRNAIDALGSEGKPEMRAAVDGLLWVVGRSLAKRMGQPR